ncbi:hypothetical protein [Chitinophaga alhagiae]|uniref:hypothetical protein n=1 Tax=Chitinophaga alhagiae TaxID=2203219 RepID=UPI0013008F70|nr:hypothetical protein [Chitinophaga alhagiae]
MKLCTLFFLVLLFPPILYAQAYGPDSWQMLGSTNDGAAPYRYYYYKILEVKGNADRYAYVADINVQADANSFNQQGTYRIRIDKYEGTVGRFDGVEIRCTSGNPEAATFYIFDNAIWMRSNNRWGAIFYKTESNAGYSSPLTGGQWGSTVEPPAGHLAETSNYGLKCDFDNNQIFRLPYVNTAGDLYTNGKLGVGVANATNQLVLPNARHIAWKSPDGTAENVGIVTNASNDLSFYVGGPDKMYIKNATGNIGIGTNDPGNYKLAVEGAICARKVKVTQQQTWADHVFEDNYALSTLYELETFVKINKHLPEVPAEKEVSTNGIDLGEMNKILLQKVEELTLYLIGHRKELDSLKKDNKIMKEELDKLRPTAAK